VLNPCALAMGNCAPAKGSEGYLSPPDKLILCIAEITLKPNVKMSSWLNFMEKNFIPTALDGNADAKSLCASWTVEGPNKISLFEVTTPDAWAALQQRVAEPDKQKIILEGTNMQESFDGKFFGDVTPEMRTTFESWNQMPGFNITCIQNSGPAFGSFAGGQKTDGFKTINPELNMCDLVMKTTVKVVPGCAEEYIILLRDVVYAHEPQPLVRVAQIISDEQVEIYLCTSQKAVLTGIKELANQDADKLVSSMNKLNTLYDTCTNKAYGVICDELKAELDKANATKIETTIDRPTMGWIGTTQFSHMDKTVELHLSKGRGCCSI